MSDLVSRDVVKEYFTEAMETGMLDIDEKDSIEQIIDDIPEGIEPTETAFDTEVSPKQIYNQFVDWAEHRGLSRENDVSVGAIEDFLFEQT